MIIPALLYLFINYQEDGAHGWGVPMATDIAFTWIDGSASKYQGVKGFYLCIGSF
jgi:hypothetical protein